jgi:hypothetical protein
MPERLALSPTLWLALAPPLAAFVWQLARGLRASRGGGTDDPWARRVGVGSVVLASGATLGHALRLARAATGVEAFVQTIGPAFAPAFAPPAGPHAGALEAGLGHAVSLEAGLGGAASLEAGLGHAGPLEAGLGLRFDSLSGAACGLACAVAIGAAAVLASRPAAERPGRAWAWLELALAGALLSFLARGFVTTLLGWTLAAGAAAWLQGWTDPGKGAVRATRGALAVTALLFGAVLLSDPGGLEGSSGGGALAVAAFLVATAAMSASPPPDGAPLPLVALACGGTTGILGPFLLLRLASMAPILPGAGRLIGIAGAAMLAGIGWTALRTSGGPARWLALVAGAPAGVTCLSLSTDGEKGGVLVLGAAGLTAGLLLLAAAVRAVPVPAPAARTDLEAALLGRVPEGVGALLLSFERWVLDAIGGAVVVVVHASAWALSRLDARRP